MTPTYQETETFRLHHTDASYLGASQHDREFAATIMRWLNIHDAKAERVLGDALSSHRLTKPTAWYSQLP